MISLDEIHPREKIGIFSNGDGQVLVIKNRKGELELPSGPVDNDSFLKGVQASTGLKLSKDKLAPLFTLSTARIDEYVSPVTLTKESFQPQGKSDVVNFEFECF